ncbi:DMSO/selenate family reductase complex B subunit [Limnochorda pilosa]|uniref:Dimethyl sulfoxide reductase subunit B n=1 Tax=Limnochorda pilosa TaxID=1555112 RepID=A0A0K2SH75_LIMPI|nr:DMSO/selenate family reductase complex B subunit [Limnochorda pilosa]BAS26154.1 dimethyl sulfoxide reductase subunit B [Limnochorda pilosa]
MKQKAWYFDASSCIGCKTCEMACKDTNDLQVGVRLRRVREYGGGHWIVRNGFEQPAGVFTYFVSTSCMHCQEPPCVNVCPAGAMQKREEDGIVVVDSEKCIGCGYCQWACPYDAPRLDPTTHIMRKCDMCIDLQDRGEKPACVANCPMRCLDFGELEELRAKYGDVDTIMPLPSGDVTKPSFVVTPPKYPSQSAGGRIRDLMEA